MLPFTPLVFYLSVLRMFSLSISVTNELDHDHHPPHLPPTSSTSVFPLITHIDQQHTRSAHKSFVVIHDH
uniref:Putative secreted protein n=1 Tax=Anopheles marajoara TaxID=58244 RepID=A0A2M4CEK6_9DIPT